MASGKFAFEKALRGRKDLTHTQFRVLAVLVTYANADLAGAHPGTRRLAEDACVSLITARRQLEALEQAGWISVVGSHHSGHGRGGVAKVYALHVPPEPRDQVLTEMSSGSVGPSAHPDDQLIAGDPVLISDDPVLISDDPVLTQMSTHHVYNHQINSPDPTPAESTSSDQDSDNQADDDRKPDPNGKAHKQPRPGVLPINDDESPAEIRMKQLRNKGLGPADAIRIMLAEQREGG